MTAILTEIIDLLVGGISEIASGIGSGLQTLVTSIFLEGTGESQSLSIFGGMIVIFAGVALAIGLSRWVLINSSFKTYLTLFEGVKAFAFANG